MIGSLMYLTNTRPDIWFAVNTFSQFLTDPRNIHKPLRTKLDPSGKKCIFVGYSESLKAYRIYFPGYKKIDISRDVTFDENTAYNKSRKKPALQLDRVQMHYFLGMEVWQSANGISLGQGKYAVEILKRFGMMDWRIWPHLWHRTWSYWVMLLCIVRWLGHWCTWRTRDKIFALPWTTWASS